MGFQFVPKSVTLNDLEVKRRNGRVFCVISHKSVDFGGYYVEVVDLLQEKCSVKNVVSGDISCMAAMRTR